MSSYNFNFGTPVYCKDKRCGALAKVALDPENNKLTNLIVEEGLLLKQSTVVPLSVVQSATAEEIVLAVDEQTFSEYPKYREEVVERVIDESVAPLAPAGGSIYGVSTPRIAQKVVVEGIAKHLVCLSKETPLEAFDTTMGKVYGLIVDEASGLLSGVMIRDGLIFVDEFPLPADMLASISAEGVFVKMTHSELTEYVETFKAP